MTKPRHPVHSNRYYHCVIRGNNKQNIFSTTTDMIALLEAFEYAYERSEFEIIAFCFMTNHYHVIIQTPNQDLSMIMSTVNRRYGNYFRRRYKYIGRLYQKRFWSKEIKSYHGLIEVSAYIHRNPIQTRVPMVSNLTHYPFSSFPFYASPHTIKPKFLNFDVIPKYLGNPYSKDSAGYCKYVLSKDFHSEDDIDEEDVVEIVRDWQDESYRFTSKIGDMIAT